MSAGALPLGAGPLGATAVHLLPTAAGAARSAGSASINILVTADTTASPLDVIRYDAPLETERPENASNP